MNGSNIRLSGHDTGARREWNEIFKMMKIMNLQPRLLHPARLLFKTEGEIESFPEHKKGKGIFYHQTSITKDIKGLALGKRRRRRRKKM